jgi:hypothetical protein
MFNFTNLVSDILLEEDPGQQQTSAAQKQPVAWLNDILKKHNDLFGSTVDINDASTGNNLINALKATYTSEDAALSLINIIRLLDFFQQMYDLFPSNSKPGIWDKFISEINKDGDNTFANFGRSYYQNIKGLTQDTRTQWDVAHAKIRKGWLQAQNVMDKQAAAALDTYNNKNVIPAVETMIKRRMDTYARFLKLKNYSALEPFSNLITEIFKAPQDYASGKKKTPASFEAVDQLYVRDIVDVALAGKEFYATEITKLKTQQLQTSSWNKFNKFINNLLQEDQPVPSPYNLQQQNQRQSQQQSQQQNQQQSQQQNQQQSQQIDKTIVNRIYQNVLNNTEQRIIFLSGGGATYSIVDAQGNDTNIVKRIDSNQYIISNIRKMETQEAKNLIKALQKISLYNKQERKKEPSGRMAAAGELASALAGLGGVGDIYGSVR